MISLLVVLDDHVPTSSCSSSGGEDKDKNLENGKPRRSRTNFTVEQLNQVYLFKFSCGIAVVDVFYGGI